MEGGRGGGVASTHSVRGVDREGDGASAERNPEEHGGREAESEASDAVQPDEIQAAATDPRERRAAEEGKRGAKEEGNGAAAAGSAESRDYRPKAKAEAGGTAQGTAGVREEAARGGFREAAKGEGAQAARRAAAIEAIVDGSETEGRGEETKRREEETVARGETTPGRGGKEKGRNGEAEEAPQYGALSQRYDKAKIGLCRIGCVVCL